MEERERFIALLMSLGCSCRGEDGKTIVFIPEESNTYSIVINDTNYIPPNFVFDIPGDVWLNVTEIPEGVEFRNGASVVLKSARKIHSSVRFLNRGGFLIPAFQRYGGQRVTEFGEFKFAVGEISSRTILNKMISLGLFDRKSHE
jgi:hypothetical protein